VADERVLGGGGADPQTLQALPRGGVVSVRLQAVRVAAVRATGSPGRGLSVTWCLLPGGEAPARHRVRSLLQDPRCAGLAADGRHVRAGRAGGAAVSALPPVASVASGPGPR